MGSISVADALRALSDDKSVAIFNIVALTLSPDTDVVMTRLALSRKQYYSRMNRLIKAGLIMRKSGKHFLTSLGKVAYQSHMLIGHAIENHWKLKAIDSIEASLPDGDLSVEERRRIIDALIERNDVKNILLNQIMVSSRNQKLVAAATTPEIAAIEK